MFQRIYGVENTKAAIGQLTAERGALLSPAGISTLAAELTDRLIASGEGVTFIDADGRPRELFAYLAELGMHPATRHLFASEAAGPIDLRRNPWSKDFRNVTRQHQIENLDPSTADVMRSVAGVSDNDDACDASNPYGKAGWNLTRQMQAEITDPARAAHLQTLAGR
jgi:hypothetical protein